MWSFKYPSPKPFRTLKVKKNTDSWIVLGNKEKVPALCLGPLLVGDLQRACQTHLSVAFCTGRSFLQAVASGAFSRGAPHREHYCIRSRRQAQWAGVPGCRARSSVLPRKQTSWDLSERMWLADAVICPATCGALGKSQNVTIRRVLNSDGIQLS